jgi:hypothetical protein
MYRTRRASGFGGGSRRRARRRDQHREWKSLSDQSLSQKSSQAPEHEETTSTSSHSMPFGAEIQSDRQTRFRFFAPSSDHVHLDVEGLVEPIPMQRDDAGMSW